MAALASGDASVAVERIIASAPSLLQRIQSRRWRALLLFAASLREPLPARARREALAALFARIQLELQLESLFARVLDAGVELLPAVHFPSTSGSQLLLDTSDVNASSVASAAGAVFGVDDGLSAGVYFKMCAVVGARLFSVFDGVTEYRPGVTLRQALSLDDDASEASCGGFFVYRTLAECLRGASAFPSNSRLLKTPRVVLRVHCSGAHRDHGGGRIVFEQITPLDVVHRG